MYDEHKALDAAVKVAMRSPCMKTQRGVVIFERDNGVMAEGFNHTPHPYQCTGTAACRAACKKICIHAEMDALMKLTTSKWHPWWMDRDGRSCLEMLHVKVVDGKPVASGPPYCWQCSRHILESGIGKMWLLHEEGLHAYTALEFHQLTLEFCGLPTDTSG